MKKKIQKKNNHLLPRFVIKRWKSNNAKIYVKADKMHYSRPILYLDYSKEYYYSLGKRNSILEDRISRFERYVGTIFKELNKANDSYVLSEKDMEILKLYVILQSCRNQDTSSYIKTDESGFYKNNHYLFGVPLITSQKDVVYFSKKICEEFERIKKMDPDSDYSYDYRIMVPGGLNSNMCFGLHLGIVTNSSNSFIVSETTSVIECTMDGDYLYTFVPISPKIGLVLVKSKYFWDKQTIEFTKYRFGRNYGCLGPDPWLSDAIQDTKLVYNGKTDNHQVTLKFVKISATEVYRLNSVIYEEGKRVLYCNEKALENAKIPNPARKVSLNH